MFLFCFFTKIELKVKTITSVQKWTAKKIAQVLKTIWIFFYYLNEFRKIFILESSEPLAIRFSSSSRTIEQILSVWPVSIAWTNVNWFKRHTLIVGSFDEPPVNKRPLDDSAIEKVPARWHRWVTNAFWPRSKSKICTLPDRYPTAMWPLLSAWMTTGFGVAAMTGFLNFPLGRHDLIMVTMCCRAGSLFS